MKRLTALLLAAFLLVGVTACQRRDRRPENTAEPESEAGAGLESSEEQDQPDPFGEEESAEQQADTRGAEQAVDELLSAMQAGDRARLQKLIPYEQTFQLQQGQSDANLLVVMQRMQYEIIEVEAQGDSAVAKVKLTNVDMGVVLPEFLRQAMEMEYNNALAESPLTPEAMEGQYTALFAQLVEANKATTVSKTIDLSLGGGAGQWKVLPDAAFGDAALGNYLISLQKTGQNAGG